MFTGIIETLGTIRAIEKDQSNVHFTVESAITHELKIDQSVAHNGCCLTVVKIEGDSYVVTAIQETLDKTNLGDWEVGSKVNLERCMLLGARLDGHIVQGHVDTTATCVSVEDLNGSWKYTFRYDFDQPTVAKGSITVNGVSLTVVDSEKGLFSVHIIPYTYEHTNFHAFKVGSKINLEFDIIGKYVARLMEQQKA
ncbi:MAG: riboflavin synthase [Fluviicola sp.]